MYSVFNNTKFYAVISQLFMKRLQKWIDTIEFCEVEERVEKGALNGGHEDHGPPTHYPYGQGLFQF